MRAHDGDKALKLVKAHATDLLVLDIMMPRVDGLRTCATAYAVDIARSKDIVRSLG